MTPNKGIEIVVGEWVDLEGASPRTEGMYLAEDTIGRILFAYFSPDDAGGFSVMDWPCNRSASVTKWAPLEVRLKP